MIRYRRLPGRRMGILRCPSAWIAEDHVLIVTGTRFEEVYQRVYLRDIQALIVRREWRFIVQWPYLLVGTWILVMVLVQPYWRSFPFISLALAIGALVAIVPIQFGCFLDLSTKVGNVPVRSVAYTWTAKRFATRVTPLILAAQEELRSEQARV